jgi:hypothetical protein
MQVWQDVPFIPMGEYWQTTAYRKGLTGIIPGHLLRARVRLCCVRDPRD